MDERCETCRYFQRDVCRRYPPTVTPRLVVMRESYGYTIEPSDDPHRTAYPSVHANNWCGEYQPADKPT